MSPYRTRLRPGDSAVFGKGRDAALCWRGCSGLSVALSSVADRHFGPGGESGCRAGNGGESAGPALGDFVLYECGSLGGTIEVSAESSQSHSGVNPVRGGETP